ncbi:MAG: S1 RNA-binding domain-containing protein, partial [Myxococcota bacterium]
RYPDLLVHRLLKAALRRDGEPAGGGAALPQGDGEMLDILDDLATDASSHERRALDVERDVVAMFRAYLMRDRVGEEFVGTISAVTGFGVFVELDRPFVEGLVKIDGMGADQFEFDEVGMRLSGKRSGLMLQLGATVLVQITGVSVPLRRIDMRLLSVDGKPVWRAAADDESPGRAARRRRDRR